MISRSRKAVESGDRGASGEGWIQKILNKGEAGQVMISLVL